MNNLVCFLIKSQEELEKVAYQTSQINYHRYFILVGFEASKTSRFTIDTDSFLEIKSYDDDTNLLKRLILCYSLPNYENIAVYLSNNVLSFDLFLAKYGGFVIINRLVYFGGFFIFVQIFAFYLVYLFVKIDWKILFEERKFKFVKK